MEFLPISTAPKTNGYAVRNNPHKSYYHSFRNPLFIRHTNPITSITFSPSKPHRFCITSSARVFVYAPRTGKVLKTITRFKETARGADIRKDGKLICSGGDEGLVQVFDLGSRAILRTMKGHEQPVHVTKFSPSNTHIASCSDDTTVRLWDVPSQTCLNTFTGHTDYVRSLVFNPTNPNLLLSGSYDSTIRLWDARTGSDEIVVSHGSNLPVEDVLLFPTGGSNVALSAGGPILRVWDLAMAGGKCVRALSNHQKTISCMSFDGGAKRVLTGGLDMMVKVYDVEDWKVVHTMRYPAPILSLAVSPDDTHIAAGMSDGTLSLRRRDNKTPLDPASQINQTLNSGAYEYFQDYEALFGTGHIKDKSQAVKGKEERIIGAAEEFRVESLRRKKLKSYDKYLKEFKYGAALDAVMENNVRPSTAFALVQELVYRDGLRTALKGRDDVTLEPILRFLFKYIADPRFAEFASEMMDVVLDIYGPVLGQSPLIEDILRKMRSRVSQELRFQEQLTSLNGALDMVLAQAALSQVV